MSGQGSGQYLPNYQDFTGQPNQQVQGAYGQGNFSTNAPNVNRGSAGQGSSNFQQPGVSNPQQQALQYQTPQMSGQQMSGQQMSGQHMSRQPMSGQQMPGQTNSQPAATHHMNPQTNYSPSASTNRNNNNQNFSPQLGGQPDVICPPHVNGQALEPNGGDAQVDMQTTSHSTPTSDSSLILSELRKLVAIFQRQEADKTGLVLDTRRMLEHTMILGMRYAEMFASLGLISQKQFSFQTARGLQNDAEANFNHLSGRFSADGSGFMTQSVNMDLENTDPHNMGQQNTSQQNASQQNASQQNASQQNINHPNMDPANLNNQNM